MIFKALIICFLLSLIKCEAMVNKTDINSSINNINVTLRASDRNFISACGDIFSKRQFVLESINYPEGYPSNLDCSYLIKGPYCPTYFQFQFLDFNIENSAGCVNDRLEVANLDAICGNKNGVKNYFSKTGALHINFKTNDVLSGRGYKILVTRFQCNEVPQTENDEQKTTVKPPKSEFYPTYNPTNNLRDCCGTTYNSKQFLLVSPNFPYTLNEQNTCIFRIEKQNFNVCRLRIEFQFFNLGAQMYNSCPEGHIEIDGKIICGCKSNIKLISSFAADENSKIIKFSSQGRGREFHTGFVLNIIQDECPKRYKPEGYTTVNDTNKFNYLNDQKNRVVWPKDNQMSFNKKLSLINERTEILDDNDNTNLHTNYDTNVVKHFYFYSYPEETNYPIKDTEELSYIYTVNINYILPDTTDFQYCYQWNNYQLRYLYSNLNENVLKCTKNNDGNHLHPTPTNCVELPYTRGYFKSPGYPYYYPNQANLCYRFRKQPGYCAIKVHLNDFQLEHSPNCQSGYLSWANSQRYCGNSLHNTVNTFDFQYNEYIEAQFRSNQQYYCGRGFFGVYEQVACQDMPYPINPVTPPYEPTTIKPSVPCDRTYQEENFLIDVHGYNLNKCLLKIRVVDYDVCEIRLTFEKFDIPCTLGYLMIDGNKYCGFLSGQTVILNANKDIKELYYKGYTNPQSPELQFKIKGQQIRFSCPEVEPQRFMINPKMSTFKNSTQDFNTNQNTNTIMFSIKNKNYFKELCGLISNTVEKELPTTLCDLFLSQNNASKCIPVQTNNKYTVTNTTSSQLQMIIGNKTEQVPYQEIDCDEINKV